MSANAVSMLPTLGIGMGYRAEIQAEIKAANKEIDFLEIITDQYIKNIWEIEALERLCADYTVIPHGVGLSIGSLFPFDRDYLRSIKYISDLTRSPYYSEHLCMTQTPGIDIGHLSPLWFTEETLRVVTTKVREIQDYLGKPLILENVTYLFDIPNGTLSQTDFFNRLVEDTNCGILVDLTNIYINSVNHHFDPFSFLQQLPLDHVVQIHLAGGIWRGGILMDSHSELIQQQSWNLLEQLAAKVEIKGAIIEHDTHFPPMDIFVTQLQKTRMIIQHSAYSQA